MKKLFELNNVMKSYPGFTLGPINLSLEPGYIMGLVGSNGAGKTTTIKSLLHAIHLDQGRVSTVPKEDIGFVIGTSAYYEFLTLSKAEKMISKFYPSWDNQKFSGLLDAFHLNPRQKIATMSQGMKLKFMIACAMSHDARLLIMDEPTSGIDPVSRQEINQILQTFIEDGQRSVLFSTHITSDLDKIADYIAILHEGKLVLNTTKDELLNRYRMVKGNPKLLEVLREQSLIQYAMESPYHFTAITDAPPSQFSSYSGDVILETCQIEDLLVHIAKGQ